MITTVLLPIALGLLVNEFCDVSPWLACKIVRWSAFRRYQDPARAEARAEELAAIINARPGKLLKLLTALGFASAATITATRRAVRARRAPREEPALAQGGLIRRIRIGPMKITWVRSELGTRGLAVRRMHARGPTRTRRRGPAQDGYNRHS